MVAGNRPVSFDPRSESAASPGFESATARQQQGGQLRFNCRDEVDGVGALLDQEDDPSDASRHCSTVIRPPNDHFLSPVNLPVMSDVVRWTTRRRRARYRPHGVAGVDLQRKVRTDEEEVERQAAVTVATAAARTGEDRCRDHADKRDHGEAGGVRLRRATASDDVARNGPNRRHPSPLPTRRRRSPLRGLAPRSVRQGAR